MWAGDQILWERKDISGQAPAGAGGVVSYFHAGGIDRPLTIWTAGVGTIVPHQSWRGQFARGMFGSGTRPGQSSECTSYPPNNGCVPVQWPGYATTAWHEGAGTPPSTGYEHFWFGSQAVGMRDASGQMYMRNRYYDPATGQFTQPDPIGLAGGLNSYGFAAGDPVTYDDPYGLAAGERDIGIGAGSCAWCEEWDQTGPPGRRGRGPRQPYRVGGRNAIPGGGLAAHEGRYNRHSGGTPGHTIAVHVNVSRSDIIARARATGKNASRFTNVNTAESAIGYVIANNRVRIEYWLTHSNLSPRLDLSLRAPIPVGQVARPDGSVIPAMNIHVTLRRDITNRGYYIETGFGSP